MNTITRTELPAQAVAFAREFRANSEWWFGEDSIASWCNLEGRMMDAIGYELTEEDGEILKVIFKADDEAGASEDDVFGEVIYAYTREQALEDGSLVDVSPVAKEAGIKWPVALTAAVHALIEAIPTSRQGIQDYQGRLWDVLYMASWAIRRSKAGDIIYYSLILDRTEERESYSLKKGKMVTRKVLVRNITLKMVAGPMGPHDPSPCITIMLPSED